MTCDLIADARSSTPPWSLSSLRRSGHNDPSRRSTSPGELVLCAIAHPRSNLGFMSLNFIGSTSYSITLAGATRKYPVVSVDSASCYSQLSQQAVRILYRRADRASTERDRRTLPNRCRNNRFVLHSRIIQWCGRWLCIAFMTDVSWPWSGLTATRLALRRRLLVLRLLVPLSDSTFYHLLDALSMCFRVHCSILGAVVLLVHVFNIHSFLFMRAW